MAEVIILSENAPYYTILVKIGENSYRQTIYSELTGTALENMLLAYAAEYETELWALQDNQ